jgi:glycosyltransferase involved in cell wall biosynthesis
MPDLLSVLMPFYNESRTLDGIARRVLATDPGVPLELVMVDDCSTDDSLAIAQRLAEADDRVRVIRHDRNRGKGAAVRTAIAEARGTILVIQDADFEYDPADYRHLIGPILLDEADAVYGSRFARGVPDGALTSSVVANKVLTRLSNVVNGLHLTDMETCYKAVRADLMKGLHLTSDRFGIEPEITARLAQAKARIVEIPISYQPRSYDEGKKIGWRDGLAAMRDIVRFRFAGRS